MRPPIVTPCECQQAGWCHRHQIDKTPALFELCRRSPGHFRLWEEGRGPLQRQQLRVEQLMRCQHRGVAPIGEVQCDLCGGRGMLVPIFQCQLFGTCTQRRFGTRTKHAREMASCAGCDKYTPIE
ncbi:MAG: hypothetical protein JWM11_2821 [Planctomycetaceae bacterium]|nr:hypothetical protein [Planctomycetaceae bacterium]